MPSGLAPFLGFTIQEAAVIAARLGNVIYWACSGLAALWLVAAAAIVVGDDRGPFAATQTYEFDLRNGPHRVKAPRNWAPERIWYSIVDDAGIRHSIVDDADPLKTTPLPGKFVNDDLVEAWFAKHNSIGFHSDGLEFLMFGLIPPLLVWLFGRACRYVLAG